MRVLELEQNFQSEETLGKVLEECAKTFEKIDYHSNLLKTNITDNPEECKKTLNELTGIYMDLKPVLAIAETEKKNREIRFYEELRIDTENNEKRFVSAVAEKQSAVSVAEYRRVRNIILAYVNVCEKGISTLQSLLKYKGEELKLQKSEG